MTPTSSDPRLDVAHTLHEFAYGIDRRDWQGYRDVFVDEPAEISFDYSSYSGRPATRMTASAWVAAVVPLFSGLDATQHSMSNAIVEMGDREADCRMYMQAAHFLWRDDLEKRTGDSNPEFSIGGYYDTHLVLDAANSWRIDAIALIVWWRRGNEAIMPLARELTSERASA